MRIEDRGREVTIVACTTFEAGTTEGTLARIRGLFDRPKARTRIVALSNRSPAQANSERLWQILRSEELREAARQRTERLGADATDLTDVLESPDVDWVEALTEGCRDASAVVVSHAQLYPALRATGLKVPIIYDAHDCLSDRKQFVYPQTTAAKSAYEHLRQAEVELCQEADAIVATNQRDAQALAELSNRSLDEIEIIANGADFSTLPSFSWQRRKRAGQLWLEAFNRLNQSAYEAFGVAIAGGQHANLDGAEHVFEIAKSRPTILFVLAGSQCEAFEQRRAPSNVVMLGKVDERTKLDLLGAAHFGLVPNRLPITQSLKLAEFMAVSLPIVSAPPSLAGLGLRGGYHAFVNDALGRAIDDSLLDAQVAGRVARAGHEFAAQTLNWTRLAEMMADVVHSATST